MRVLVLGASGFVGRKLVARLVADGVPVLAGVRRRPDHETPGAETRLFEASDRASIAVAMEGATHVVNAVMGARAAMEGSTHHVAAEALRQGVARVAHMSSIAVYGAAEGRVGEDHAFTLAGDDYAQAKIACEATMAQAMTQGLDAVILRPALVYGRGSALWTDRVARLLRAGRLGDLGEAGDGFCNLIHVDDVVAAIVTALRRGDAGGQAYNLSAPAPPTWNGYLMAFARALGATPVARLPAWRLRLEKRAAPPLKLMEMAAGAAGLRRLAPDPITPGLMSLLDRRAIYASDKADVLIESPGYTSLSAGLAEAAA